MAVPKLKQVISGVYNKLNDSGSLTTLLGTFESRACIFTGGVPSLAPRPYIRIRFPKNISDESTKNTFGWTMDIEVIAVVDHKANTASVNALADIVDEILAALHLQDLSITDNHLYTVMNSMSQANSSDDLIAHQITFNVEITS